ncbi:hypothetical protein F8568_001590 [Actinomadura sp. LD22]|uniref:Uncharacterized protein n=1 Tax=Actinomadura physcomitrii TaxID=2650748 RepID=A0A6I4M5I9_9ACTN|nr:hypothetical protein [Actinomadura physcomitrii]MVZ99100.1 hypothetical protein [Actinomadura physcomitrii]
MKFRKFKALVSLDERALGTDLPAQDCPFTLREKGGDPNPDAFHKVVVSTDDGEPLRPGDVDHIVTMTMLTETAGPGAFPAGRRFDLWHGEKVGHGLVSRRMVT